MSEHAGAPDRERIYGRLVQALAFRLLTLTMVGQVGEKAPRFRHWTHSVANASLPLFPGPTS
jgi:hypothetical protein